MVMVTLSPQFRYLTSFRRWCGELYDGIRAVYHAHDRKVYPEPVGETKTCSILYDKIQIF